MNERKGSERTGQMLNFSNIAAAINLTGNDGVTAVSKKQTVVQRDGKSSVHTKTTKDRNGVTTTTQTTETREGGRR